MIDIRSSKKVLDREIEDDQVGVDHVRDNVEGLLEKMNMNGKILIIKGKDRGREKIVQKEEIKVNQVNLYHLHDHLLIHSF